MWRGGRGSQRWQFSAAVTTIQQYMFSEVKKTSNCLETSLDFQKEFTYIHMGRQHGDKDNQRLQLKLLSKISKPLPSSHSRPSTNRKPQTPRLRSHSRKNPKKEDKSLSKRKLSNKDCPPKPISTRREYKTLQPKTNEKHLRFIPKTSRQVLNKNSIKETSKRFPKKKKAKEAALTVSQKESGCSKGKGLATKKLVKVRSEKGLDGINASEMSRKVKREQREEKVMQEYFGMTEKLSSIVEEKSSARLLQREKSRLSKCKTHSSSSSLHFNKPKNKR